MQRQLDSLGLSYQFVEAVDKYDLDSKASRLIFANQLGISKFDMEYMYKNHEDDTMFMLAPKLSHVKAHNLIVKNRDTVACVLEDDSYLLPSFPSLLAIAKEIDYDVLTLASIPSFGIHLAYQHKFQNFGLRTFPQFLYTLIHYKKNYPSLEPYTVRLMALKYMKYFLIHIKHPHKTKKKPPPIVNCCSEIGAIPTQDRSSWYKATENHFIAAPHTENPYKRYFEGMAYMIRPLAVTEIRQKIIKNRDSIDDWRKYSHPEGNLNLYTVVPPCVQHSHTYQPRSRSSRLS